MKKQVASIMINSLMNKIAVNKTEIWKKIFQ